MNKTKQTQERTHFDHLLGSDYLNNWCWISYALSVGENPKEHRLKVKSFYERYKDEIEGLKKDSRRILSDPETDRKIKRLDELAEETNATIEAEPLDLDKLYVLVSEAYQICRPDKGLDILERAFQMYRERK